MVAKVEAYGLAKESLQLLSDYLSYCKQRMKIGSACSDFWNSASLAVVISQMITLWFHMAALFPKL